MRRRSMLKREVKTVTHEEQPKAPYLAHMLYKLFILSRLVLRAYVLMLMFELEQIEVQYQTQIGFEGMLIESLVGKDSAFEYVRG